MLEFYDVVCTIDPAKLAVTGIAGCAKPPRQVPPPRPAYNHFAALL